MTNQSAAAPSQRGFLLFLATSGMLIASFLWRTLTVAHEYPMRTEQVLTMLIDGGLILGLIGVRKSGPAWLFWAAIAAGISLFLIRMTGDAAWWTGHLMFSIYRR